MKTLLSDIEDYYILLMCTSCRATLLSTVSPDSHVYISISIHFTTENYGDELQLILNCSTLPNFSFTISTSLVEKGIVLVDTALRCTGKDDKNVSSMLVSSATQT